MNRAIPAIEKAKVISLTRPAERYFELELEAPKTAATAQPGQFVNISAPETGGMLLRRPFSIARRKGSRIHLLIKEVGNATRAMRDLRLGDEIEIFGPLGNGFNIPRGGACESILVAGGYGVAGLGMLAERLLDEGGGVTFIVGARNAGELVWRGYLAGLKGLSVQYATDDGSEGFCGTAIQLLARMLRDAKYRGANIYACGPMQMLKALWLETRAESAQVAVEARMACGIGICQGCAVPMAGGKGNGKYLRACKEGPIFEAGRIDWGSWRT